jgi:methionine-rich copper-binding protein CopC
MPLKRLLMAVLAASVLLLLPRAAFAHAHLVSSSPAANAAVQGPDVAIDLRFNSRVALKGSMITLVLSGGQTQRLTLDSQSNETNLDSRAHLRSGSYTLRWQALSTDGHITRGEIPFTVR